MTVGKGVDFSHLPFDLVDAHHHLWDLSRLPYPWLAPESSPRPFGDHSSIQKNYLVEDYRHDLDGLPVRASVVIEAACAAPDPAAEADWLGAILEAEEKRTGASFRIVSALDFRLHDPGAAIAGAVRNARVSGVRAGLAWREGSPWRFAPGPEFSRTATFLRAVEQVAAAGLSLDLVVLPEQLDEAAEIAAMHPTLPIAIDHMATVEPERIDTWKPRISRLAVQPNITVKLSGLWSLSRAWEPEIIGPAVRHALRELGPHRLMWGSNMPVEGVMCPVRRQLAALLTALGDIGQPECVAIFSGTARKFYWREARQ